MKNKIEYYLLKFLTFLISRFNLHCARRLAKFLALLFYYFIPIRKKVVIKNLKIAFPELNKKEVANLIKKAYQNLFIVLLEILYLPYLKKEEIENLLQIKNSEIIQEALSLNKGLIFVSAHFGNWEILALSAALRLKTQFSIVTKPLRNPYVDNFINEWRTKFGNKVVPLGLSVKNIFKELLEKKIIALLADQRASQNSLELKFFNKTTHVYEGPAVMSIKTGAPLIFAIAIRQNDYSYIVELKEIKQSDIKNEQEKIKVITEKYIAYLEDYIRIYPDQWLWFHNRWKH
ncbi:MAG: lysophospholipid acyltransferase family protein [Ignavibacteria bacterium]